MGCEKRAGKQSWGPAKGKRTESGETGRGGKGEGGREGGWRVLHTVDWWDGTWSAVSDTLGSLRGSGLAERGSSVPECLRSSVREDTAQWAPQKPNGPLPNEEQISFVSQDRGDPNSLSLQLPPGEAPGPTFWTLWCGDRLSGPLRAAVLGVGPWKGLGAAQQRREGLPGRAQPAHWP